jgi:hypothetical protein
VRRVEVPVERPQRETVPVRARVGELGDLLAEGPQGDDLTLGAQAYTVKVPAIVAQVQIVSLLEDAKLFVLHQVERPSCGIGPGPSVMLVVEEVTKAIPPGRNGMEMTAFTAN